MSEKGLQTRERILAAAEPLVLTQGFAGTSLDNVLSKAGVTKGAFFHHFKGKDDLARALIERFVARDLAAFVRFAEQAEAATSDPLERMVHFLELFEKEIERLRQPLDGCMLAVYIYESVHFDPSINTYVADSLRSWTAIYERKFEAILERYEPSRPVTARELADMIVAIIEGGFILSRAYNDAHLIVQQSRQFRLFLDLLFPGKTKARRSGTR